VPFLNGIIGPLPIFQQDNATSHVSLKTLRWFAEKNIAVMKFPACSPDLNPMENLWAELSSMIYSGSRTFTSREELIQAIKLACTEIRTSKKDYLINLSKSVLRRCIDVIEHRGDETKY